MIFLNNSNFNAPITSCLKNLVLTPRVLIKLIFLTRLDAKLMLTKGKHLDTARFNYLIIFHEYLMLYDFCSESLWNLAFTLTLFSTLKFSGY